MKAALLFSLLFGTARGPQAACAATPAATVLDVEMCWADYYARGFGVPMEFVQAVIDVESAWHPYVISAKGAAGLMQLTAPTAFTFGVHNRFRIEENIRGGVAYLAYLIRQFGGELRLVAAAYYAGEKRIKKQGLRCADADIYRYVSRVQRFYLRRQMVARTTVRNYQRSRRPMKCLNLLIGGVCACLISSAQVPEVRPQVAGRAVQEGQVTIVYLAPRFATAIRMPDAVNSVVLGDPDSFTAEHSEREPQIVFVKPITAKAAQTNLLISTGYGYQASLLLISRGESAGTHPQVDFVMRYRPAGRFVIEPSAPSLSIAQTVALPTSSQAVEPPGTSRGAGRSTIEHISVIPGKNGTLADVGTSEGVPSALGLDTLLERQRRAPLPALYGTKPGIVPPDKQILKAGVSEVIDQGK